MTQVTRDNVTATYIVSFFSQIIECQRRVNPGLDVNEAEAQVKRVKLNKILIFSTSFLLKIVKAGGPVEQKAPGTISGGGA